MKPQMHADIRGLRSIVIPCAISTKDEYVKQFAVLSEFFLYGKLAWGNIFFGDQHMIKAM